MPRALVYGAALALVTTVTVVSGDSRYLSTGDSFPGLSTALAYSTLRLIATLAGASTLGALAFALICTRIEKGGRVGPQGYACLLSSTRSGVLWLVTSVALVPVSAADATGTSVGSAFREGVVLDLVSANEAPKAWLVSAVLAAMVAAISRVSLSWVSVAAAAAISAVAVLPAWVVGNAGQGRDHDIATSAVIVAVIALSVWSGMAPRLSELMRHNGIGDADTLAAARRHRLVARCVAVMTIGLGAVLMTVLLPASSVLTTTYGTLAVASTVLLVVAAACSCVTIGGRASTLVASTALTLSWATITVMAIRPAPVFLTRPATAYDILLGFDPPGPPSLEHFATFWRFDFVTGSAAVVMATLYAWGVVRLRRRGDHWPVGRTVAWMIGCLALLLATSSGVAAYGSSMFSVHMAVHMTLNMFVPVLLVLGGPVTLALRAIPPARGGAMPGPREWIVLLVHSRPMRLVSNPAVAVGLFVLSLYAVYFSPLFDTLVRYHWGHELMNIHFLVTGYLYYWVVIGIDPGPKRLPHLGRLGLLFAVMPFHAFFGIAVMTMERIIGDSFYSFLQLPWVADLAADQRFGGGLAWASSEVPLVLVVVALVTQWARTDRRTEIRQDRFADNTDDDELAAYNAMLTQLARSRR